MLSSCAHAQNSASSVASGCEVPIKEGASLRWESEFAHLSPALQDSEPLLYRGAIMSVTCLLVALVICYTAAAPTEQTRPVRASH